MNILCCGVLFLPCKFITFKNQLKCCKKDTKKAILDTDWPVTSSLSMKVRHNYTENVREFVLHKKSVSLTSYAQAIIFVGV